MPTFHQFTQRLQSVVLPLQDMVNLPFRLYSWTTTEWVDHQKLLEQIATLEARQTLLQAKLQRISLLEKENKQLQALLGSSVQIKGRVFATHLLAIATNPATSVIILDAGANHQLYVGQPVVDAFGVLGQIVDVAPLTSKVLLLTDKTSAVPVEDYRSGVRAIAIGNGNGNPLTLFGVAKTADVKTGDKFVASGLGLVYPYGYPVGVVSRANRSSSSRFLDADLVVSAHLDSMRQVLAVWPEKQSLNTSVKAQLNKPLSNNTTEAK